MDTRKGRLSKEPERDRDLGYTAHGRTSYYQPWVGSGPNLLFPHGSIAGGLYNAALEGILATADLISATTASYIDRVRAQWQLGVYDPVAATVATTQEVVGRAATMSQRTWEAYRDSVTWPAPAPTPAPTGTGAVPPATGVSGT